MSQQFSAQGSVVVRRRPKDGEPGEKGAKPWFSTYAAGNAYRSGAAGEEYFDIVYVTAHNKFYRCIQSYSASYTHDPVNGASSSWWEYLVGYELIVADMLLANQAFINNLTVKKLSTTGDTELEIADNEIKLFDSSGNLRTWVHGNDLTDYTTSTTDSVSYNAGSVSSQRTGLSRTVTVGSFNIATATDTVKIYGSKSFLFSFSGKCGSQAPAQLMSVNCYLSVRIRHISSDTVTELYSGSADLTFTAGPNMNVGNALTLTASQSTAISNLALGAYKLEVYMGMSPNSSALYYSMDSSNYTASQSNSGTVHVVHQNSGIAQITEIGRNGVQIFKDNSKYIRLGLVKGNDNVIVEGGFQFRAGSYGFMLHPSIGFMKWDNSNSIWVTTSI